MKTLTTRATLALLLLPIAGWSQDIKMPPTATSGVKPAPSLEAAPMPEPPKPPPPPLETFYYRCQHAKGDAMKDILDTLTTPRGKVTFSESLHTLVVTDEADQIKTLKDALTRLDTLQPQVQVQARIVEVTLDSDLEKEMNLVFNQAGKNGVGIIQGGSFQNLSTPGANPQTTQGLRLNLRAWANGDLTETLDGFIRLLLTQNKAKILSSPNIVVDQDSEASIIAGEEDPIQTVNASGGVTSTSTTFKRVGIKLKVTPMQIAEDSVRLMVAPEVSSVTGFTAAGTTPGAVSNPIIAVRNTKTVLTLKDGQTLVIGGLKRQETHRITNKIPLLGDIPLLGGLFRSERDQVDSTMLIFYLRVQILKDGAAPPDNGIDTPEMLKTEGEREQKIETEHETVRKKIPW